MFKAVGFLFRLFSYLFFFVTSLLLLGIAGLVTFYHQPMNLRMLPFEQGKMLWGTYAIAVAGLLVLFLALTRKMRWLYPLWAATTLYTLLNGYLFSPYVFRSEDDFHAALWFIGAAALAFIGALWTLRPRRGRLYS